MSDLTHAPGVLAPILTPFDETGAPDAERLVAHARHLLAEGCTGLVAFGTTSEATSLGLEERMSLLEAMLAGGIAPEALMVGTGTPAIPDTVRLARHALSLGCTAQLMLPPYYYKAVHDDGLFESFARVIEEVADSRLRIHLYHIPPVAQVGFSAPLVGRLVAAFPETVVGLKDSSGDFTLSSALLEAHPGFRVYAGSEKFLLDNLRAGGAGCITATANIFPRLIRRLLDTWQDASADALQEAITALRRDVSAQPLIPFLKAWMANRLGDAAWSHPRPPLMALEPEQAARAIAALKARHGDLLGAAAAPAA